MSKVPRCSVAESSRTELSANEPVRAGELCREKLLVDPRQRLGARMPVRCGRWTNVQVVSENQVERILERTLKTLSEMPFVTGIQGPGIESKKKKRRGWTFDQEKLRLVKDRVSVEVLRRSKAGRKQDGSD